MHCGGFIISLPCLAEGRAVVDVLAERARVEPHAVRLRRVDAEEVVLRVEVEGFLELEIPEGLEVLLLRERADDGRAELESFREAGALVLRADARREHLLRARATRSSGLIGKVGREEQRLLVDANQSVVNKPPRNSASASAAKV